MKACPPGIVQEFDQFLQEWLSRHEQEFAGECDVWHEPRLYQHNDKVFFVRVSFPCIGYMDGEFTRRDIIAHFIRDDDDSWKEPREMGWPDETWAAWNEFDHEIKCRSIAEAIAIAKVGVGSK